MELTKDMTLHGFKVRYVQPIPEFKATLYRMDHVKSGADLVWLSRPDDNKTFSIAFKTIPSDDTGVFHILEHSVLCGSRKYPVREPFVELLKSSLQTFLNAMTFPDKTMYPVCSRNDQDFLNLMDVYLDAVLHPLSVESPLGFRQEGWHYELDSPEGELTRNGVVFNEMKGAFVDPDEVLSFELGRKLFPDNCYGYESGGHPEHIPELTFEKYLENHARYYHPSNSYIFLDGEIDLDAVLSKIDGYLSEYDRLDVDADIPMQAPVHPEETVVSYEIGPDDDESGKVLLGRGWVYGSFADQERIYAASILCRALAGTNESPLKKAVLDAGLAQDINLYSMDGVQQPRITLEAKNTDLSKKEKLLETIESVLREQAKGMDRKELHAILNRVEFQNREKDFGRMPRGLVFAMMSLETWLYGGDPAQTLDNSELFKTLRRRIDEGWFEKLIGELMLDNPHTATVTLVPSKTLSSERAERDRAELARIKAAWTPEETQSVIAEFAALRQHQSSGDTPETLATLPKLALSDIPEKGAELPYSVSEHRGVTILRQDVETGGIVYLDLNFECGDLTLEEIARLNMLSTLLGNLGTDRHTALEIGNLLRERVGRLSVSFNSYVHRDGRVRPVVTASLAVLPERKEEAMELLEEVLLHTSFTDTASVFNTLRQARIGLEQMAMSSGNAFAYVRAAASQTGSGAVADAMRGVTQLRYLQNADRTFEERGGEIAASYGELAKKIFTRSRLTIAAAGDADSLIDTAIDILPEGTVGTAVEYKPLDIPPEGFSIPAAIGFAGESAWLKSVGAEFDGSMLVAAKLLTLDYLWNAVRVKGGAYGVNMGVSESGGISFTSFRDPSCAGSLETFAKAGEALRAFTAAGEAPDKYIIATIGGMEPVMTPRQENTRAASLYYTGRTQADLQRVRGQVLRTDLAALERFSHTLDALVPHTAPCVVGGSPLLDACGDKLAKIEPIQQ